MSHYAEIDIFTEYIAGAIQNPGWDIETQVREEVFFTKVLIIVRQKMAAHGKSKRADYIINISPTFPLLFLKQKMIDMK